MRAEILYTTNHEGHNPPFEVENGSQDTYWDTPERVQAIITSLTESGYKIKKAPEHSESEITRVHSKEYVNFIRRISQTTDTWLYPSVFPGNIDPSGHGDYSLMGHYSMDLGAPIGPDTFKAAKKSVDVAVEAADEVFQGSRLIYALCRPPGHHAEVSRMGGYCYFNNAAISADKLSALGRVAILDLDVHHFNGTQDIFYTRPDVLTISLHAEPKMAYPGFSGFENEIGQGAGRGFNINYPLPPQETGNSQYDKKLTQALADINRYNPQFLVVSLGVDTYIDDPMELFKLTTDYYHEVGKKINKLNRPTLVVQEGGYNLADLGKNVVSFFEGFRQDPEVID